MVRDHYFRNESWKIDLWYFMRRIMIYHGFQRHLWCSARYPLGLNDNFCTLLPFDWRFPYSLRGQPDRSCHWLRPVFLRFYVRSKSPRLPYLPWYMLFRLRPQNISFLPPSLRFPLLKLSIRPTFSVQTLRRCAVNSVYHSCSMHWS